MHLGCVCPSLQGIVRASVAYPENTLALRSTYGGDSIRPKGIGDLIKAAFALPENTIENVAGKTPNLGCACSRGMSVRRGGGLGDLSQVWNDLTTGSLSVVGIDIPYWALGAAGAAAVLLFMSGRPSGYKEAVARVRKSYPTTVGRIRRAVQSY